MDYNEMKTTKNRSKYEKKKLILLETRKAIYINIKQLKSFSLYAYSRVPGNPERKKNVLSKLNRAHSESTI